MIKKIQSHFLLIISLLFIFLQTSVTSANTNQKLSYDAYIHQLEKRQLLRLKLYTSSLFTEGQGICNGKMIIARKVITNQLLCRENQSLLSQFRR